MFQADFECLLLLLFLSPMSRLSFSADSWFLSASDLIFIRNAHIRQVFLLLGTPATDRVERPSVLPLRLCVFQDGFDGWRTSLHRILPNTLYPIARNLCLSNG